MTVGQAAHHGAGGRFASQGACEKHKGSRQQRGEYQDDLNAAHGFQASMAMLGSAILQDDFERNSTTLTDISKTDLLCSE